MGALDLVSRIGLGRVLSHPKSRKHDIACINHTKQTDMLSLHVDTTMQNFLTEHSSTIGLVSYFTARKGLDIIDSYSQFISTELVEKVQQVGGKRVALGVADAEAGWREDRVDSVVVDEFPSGHCALVYAASLAKFCELNGNCVEKLFVLVVAPTTLFPALTYCAAVVLSRLCPLSDRQGCADSPLYQPEGLRWSDDDPKINSPVYVFNLNKMNRVAQYTAGCVEKNEPSPVSGRMAYRRYRDLFSQLRRGVYMPYVGSVVGSIVVTTEERHPLTAGWDDFILVRYPSRRALSAMLGSLSYGRRVHHREAALERAIVIPADPAKANS